MKVIARAITPKVLTGYGGAGVKYGSSRQTAITPHRIAPESPTQPQAVEYAQLQHHR